MKTMTKESSLMLTTTAQGAKSRKMKIKTTALTLNNMLQTEFFKINTCNAMPKKKSNVIQSLTILENMLIGKLFIKFAFA